MFILGIGGLTTLLAIGLTGLRTDGIATLLLAILMLLDLAIALLAAKEAGIILFTDLLVTNLTGDRTILLVESTDLLTGAIATRLAGGLLGILLLTIALLLTGALATGLLTPALTGSTLLLAAALLAHGLHGLLAVDALRIANLDGRLLIRFLIFIYPHLKIFPRKNLDR
jgi:hypothetical protein